MKIQMMAFANKNEFEKRTFKIDGETNIYFS